MVFDKYNYKIKKKLLKLLKKRSGCKNIEVLAIISILRHDVRILCNGWNDDIRDKKRYVLLLNDTYRSDRKMISYIRDQYGMCDWEVYDYKYWSKLVRTSLILKDMRIILKYYNESNKLYFKIDDSEYEKEDAVEKLGAFAYLRYTHGLFNRYMNYIINNEYCMCEIFDSEEYRDLTKLISQLDKDQAIALEENKQIPDLNEIYRLMCSIEFETNVAIDYENITSLIPIYLDAVMANIDIREIAARDRSISNFTTLWSPPNNMNIDCYKEDVKRWLNTFTPSVSMLGDTVIFTYQSPKKFTDSEYVKESSELLSRYFIHWINYFFSKEIKKFMNGKIFMWNHNICRNDKSMREIGDILEDYIKNTLLVGSFGIDSFINSYVDLFMDIHMDENIETASEDYIKDYNTYFEIFGLI